MAKYSSRFRNLMVEAVYWQGRLAKTTNGHEWDCPYVECHLRSAWLKGYNFEADTQENKETTTLILQ